MKVIILKSSGEKDIGQRVQEIIAGEKSTGRVRIFCPDEAVQQRLVAAGIASEVLDDFQRHVGADDEPSWDKVFALSDELRSSAEGDKLLKFSGVSFLTLERNIIKYVFAVKLANLCRRVAAQDCAVLILVLTEPYGSWLADLNSPGIITINYGKESLRQYLRDKAYLLATFARYYLQKLTVQDRPHRETGQGPSVLFVVTTPLYARPALAIAEACRDGGLTPYLATDDPRVIPLLKGRNISYWLRPPFSPRSAPALSARLGRHISTLPIADGDELSAESLCRQTLLGELPGLCREIVSSIVFLERLLKSTSPDIVCVMPHSSFLQQIGWSLAKQKYGLPVLACSAAWETSEAGSFRRHLHADKIAVMGERIRDIYLQSGLAPERVVATGVAHFDRLFTRDREQDAQVLVQQGIDPNQRIIVFATEGLSVNETVEALIGVIEAVLKMKDVQLVVKVHPAEPMEPYQEAAGRYHNPRIHVLKDIDLYALINCSDLVIVKYSTVALEAMMIDKPVVTINLSGKPVPVPYAEEGAAIGVYRHEDIGSAISGALDDAETRARIKAGRDKFVRAWASEPDGQASQRIVNLMKQMIAESRTGKGQHAAG